MTLIGRVLGLRFTFHCQQEGVIRSLDQIIAWRGKLKFISCDNVPEYISKLLNKWAKEKNIKFLFIQLGQPQQNEYIERYH